MSLIRREIVPPEVLAEIDACGECEGSRRPRMWVCLYHDGWWAGWEAAIERLGGAT